MVQMVACVKVFHVLEVFEEDKYNYAPLILRTLISSMSQVAADVRVREIYFENLRSFFTKSKHYPIGIALDPVVSLYANRI